MTTNNPPARRTNPPSWAAVMRPLAVHVPVARAGRAEIVVVRHYTWFADEARVALVTWPHVPPAAEGEAGDVNLASLARLSVRLCDAAGPARRIVLDVAGMTAPPAGLTAHDVVAATLDATRRNLQGMGAARLEVTGLHVRPDLATFAWPDMLAPAEALGSAA